MFYVFKYKKKEILKEGEKEKWRRAVETHKQKTTLFFDSFF